MGPEPEPLSRFPFRVCPILRAAIRVSSRRGEPFFERLPEGMLRPVAVSDLVVGGREEVVRGAQ
jgi:hypothetical protein